jgi:multidrug resistance efflux pump
MTPEYLDQIEARWSRKGLGAWDALSAGHEFNAHAIRDVPALIAEVRKLQADLAGARYELDLTRQKLAEAQADTERLDWLWDNGWIDADDNDGKLDSRAAIDAARSGK